MPDKPQGQREVNANLGRGPRPPLTTRRAKQYHCVCPHHHVGGPVGYIAAEKTHPDTTLPIMAWPEGFVPLKRREGKMSEICCECRSTIQPNYRGACVTCLRREIKRLEAIVAACESDNVQLRAAGKRMLAVYEALMPGLRHIAVKDYREINDAPIEMRRLCGATEAEGGDDE